MLYWVLVMQLVIEKSGITFLVAHQWPSQTHDFLS